MTAFLDNLWAVLSGARRVVEGAPAQRRVAEMIPKERVALDEDPDPDLVRGEPFVPGGCYFGIRLAGLHLTQARRYATRQLPLCVCMAEFSRAGEPRTVPFSVGPGIIRDRLKAAGVTDAEGAEKAWIELRDITVLRPTPVGSGNLSLFAGIYSVAGDDLVRTLLNVVGDLGGSLGTTALGPAVKVAESVYGGFSSLLRLDAVTPKAEALNGRALAKRGSGYLLVGNAEADVIEKRSLSVRRGVLCQGEGKQIVTDFDYCLIALERHASLVEQATGLAPELFGDTWREALEALGSGNLETAGRLQERLVSAILSTPDLIEADRDLLVGGYLALYHKRAEQIAAVRGTRGATADLATSVSDLSQRATHRDRALSDALDSVYTQMKEDQPGTALAKAGPPGGDDVVREALALRERLTQAATPGSLARALSRAVLAAEAP